MAWEEIKEQPFSKIVKAKDVFAKIGDKFLGLYVSHTAGLYGEDYVFDTDIGPLKLTVKGALKAQLEKANLQGGELVAIQFAKNVNVGKESPMKSFKVMIDRGGASAPPKNGANVKPLERAVTEVW
jgi:hypothetical protein